MAGSRSRSRSRSRSPLRKPLPHGAASISESDYFQKSDEFRLWLKDEKGKYFDELSGEKARSYFRKFVKAWNRASLSRSFYAGDIEPLGTTGYKWSFAKSKGRDDDKASSRSQDTHKSKSSSSAGPSRVLGPTLPSTADLVLAREREEEDRKAERSYKRKRDKVEDKERIEEMVGPREVGRAGQLEKKRAKREGDRAFREKGDEGLEVDESTLLGGGDSFKDYIMKREEGKKRYSAKEEEKAAAFRERSDQRKEKESATMAMFQQLAKQRFG
ncbi:hypothetical protein C8J56DRAFT_33594 [Mycena floridula]|nr:hypothetical protein C8J56DRAFT_33594 [Mycena floridula]